jgi:cytidine deaminase
MTFQTRETIICSELGTEATPLPWTNKYCYTSPTLGMTGFDAGYKPCGACRERLVSRK